MDCPWLVYAITLWLLNINLQSVLLCSPNGYEILTNTQGHLSSPNYPKYNPKATQCHWLISVQDGYVISLEFEVFDVGHTSECWGHEARKTYVEVRVGTNNASIGTFCGSSKPKAISSSTNQMWIVYVTNGYKSTKFVARYTTTKDSSVAVIMLLALGAIFGTIICIVITIIFIRRRNRQLDDEISPPSRDNNPDNDAKACAVTQIPSLILLGAINKGMDDCGTETRPVQFHSKHKDVALNGILNSNFHDIKNNVTIDNYNHELRRSPQQDMTIIDIDNMYTLRNAGITAPIDNKRPSDSVSVLTTAKVIFVQDSSSSRSSSSSSSN